MAVDQRSLEMYKQRLPLPLLLQPMVRPFLHMAEVTTPTTRVAEGAEVKAVDAMATSTRTT